MALHVNLGKGVMLGQIKEPAFSKPIMRLRPPETVVVPIFDFGAGSMLPVPRVGESIAKNAILAKSKNGAAWVISPVSGRLSRIERVAHPVIGNVLCAFINIRDNIPALEVKGHNPSSMTSAGVIQAARNACIFDESDGLPLFYKLQKAKRDKIMLTVADGIDDSPCVSSSLKIISEYGVDCADGLGFILKALDGGKAVLAAYDPGDLDMDSVLNTFGFVEVIRIAGGYPAWPRFVEEHCREPYLRVGVQALRALSLAVRTGQPQTETVITVSGDCIQNPCNVVVPTGTTIRYILEEVGLKKPLKYVILGDTMRGILCDNLDVPVFPGIRAITAVSELDHLPERLCINCGRCVSVCPHNLFPSLAVSMYENGENFDPSLYGGDRCDACGACAAVCPAGINVTEIVLGEKGFGY